jgi:type IX secretion system PorP/SprF family membrane protein
MKMKNQINKAGIVMTGLLVVLSFLITIKGFAQQIPLFSQYQLNKYVYNPAVAGSEDYLDIRFMQRYQWRGITDAPRTFNLSAYSPIQNQKMGVGGILYSDIVGPTRRTGVQGSYAYHLSFKNNMKLSFGLALGVDQYVVDGTQIKLDDIDDPSLLNYRGSSMEFIAKFGVYFYADNFYVGFSIPQLFNDQIKLYESTTDLSKLEDHYMLNGGYKFHLGDDFILEPAVMFRYVSPTPVQTDISLWAYWREMLWLGFTYRTYDAIAFSVGFNYNETFLLGYSYDYTLSDLSTYTSGSHEIMLGIRFNQNSVSGEKPLLE